ncbi:unnamed protein product [Adineta steineri]|uniref:Transmembrane protein n=1 Tax=Adineta steineri TaxID=433720 RepID=A0A813PM78_9BILA|nr:unnamed protein product [Adineta steineri]CAF0792716.1 unnamed protein product [Adineta steineri]
MFIGKISIDCKSLRPPPRIQQNITFVQPPNSSHDSYIHPDYYVIGVEPYGKFAFGFSNAFILVYDLNYLKLLSWPASLTWPNSTFLPLAVDVTSSFAAVAGFTYGTDSFTPTVYLITYKLYALGEALFNSASFNCSSDGQLCLRDAASLVVAAKWSSEKSLVNPLMKMSLSVNDNDGRILVGISADNIIKTFVTNGSSDKINLTYVSSRKNNPGALEYGYGAGVTWLNQGKKAAVLANVYVGTTLIRSRIHFYDMTMSTITDETSPVSIFPNRQQPSTEYSSLEGARSIETYFGPLIAGISSNSLENDPSSLNVLDTDGRILVIFPSKPGFYSSSFSMGYTVSSPSTLFSFLCLQPDTSKCPPGMHKNDSGPWSCSLCETGTMYPGIRNNTGFNCIRCSNESFCAVGSISESKLLEDVNETHSYPQSPETVVYDDILMQTTFSIDCLVESPLFWSLIVTGFTLIIVFMMGIFKFSLRFKNVRLFLKKLFRHGDILGEGEFWIGGLFSIAIVVLLSLVYKFSYSFYYQYPIEGSHGPTFSCKSRPHNSKFHTSLQFLSVQSAEQASVFSQLNSQEFTIIVEFMNTGYTCNDLTIESSFILMLPTTCSTEWNIIFVSVKLPSHFITLKFTFFGMSTIAGLRVGLTGPGGYDKESTSRQLNFSKLFFESNKVLSQNPSIQLQLTKIINITDGLKTDDKTNYSGVWTPTFLFDAEQMFLSQQQYQSQEATLGTVLSIKTSETPFFVKNEQTPIAKQPEIIFHTILFTGVCLDLVGMVILLSKLLIFPTFKVLIEKLFHKTHRIRQMIINTADDIEQAETTSSKLMREEVNQLKQQVIALTKLVQNKSVLPVTYHPVSRINPALHGHPSTVTIQDLEWED